MKQVSLKPNTSQFALNHLPIATHFCSDVNIFFSNFNKLSKWVVFWFVYFTLDPISNRLFFETRSHRIQRDSNPGPLGLESNVLPSELPCFGINFFNLLAKFCWCFQHTKWSNYSHNKKYIIPLINFHLPSSAMMSVLVFLLQREERKDSKLFSDIYFDNKTAKLNKNLL